MIHNTSSESIFELEIEMAMHKKILADVHYNHLLKYLQLSTDCLSGHSGIYRNF